MISDGEKKKKKDNTRPDPSPLKFEQSMLSASQCYYYNIILNLKAHLKVERQAMIIEKDSLGKPVNMSVDIQASPRDKVDSGGTYQKSDYTSFTKVSDLTRSVQVL